MTQNTPNKTNLFFNIRLEEAIESFDEVFDDSGCKGALLGAPEWQTIREHINNQEAIIKELQSIVDEDESSSPSSFDDAYALVLCDGRAKDEPWLRQACHRMFEAGQRSNKNSNEPT